MDEKKKLIIWTIFLVLLTVLIATSLLMTLLNHTKTDLEYLKETIDNKTGVSDDYRLGWNDAINALKDFRMNLVTNATK